MDRCRGVHGHAGFDSARRWRGRERPAEKDQGRELRLDRDCDRMGNGRGGGHLHRGRLRQPGGAYQSRGDVGGGISSGNWSNVLLFWAAQFLGAFVGAILVWLVYLPHWKETPDQGAKLAVFCNAPAIRKFSGEPHDRNYRDGLPDRGRLQLWKQVSRADGPRSWF